MGKLPEAKAWRFIAEDYADPQPKPDTGRVSGHGLCFASDKLRYMGVISYEVWYDMEDRLRDAMNSAGVSAGSYIFYAGNGWACDTSNDARDARCMIALWFALDAENETT